MRWLTHSGVTKGDKHIVRGKGAIVEAARVALDTSILTNQSFASRSVGSARTQLRESVTTKRYGKGETIQKLCTLVVCQNVFAQNANLARFLIRQGHFEISDLGVCCEFVVFSRAFEEAKQMFALNVMLFQRLTFHPCSHAYILCKWVCRNGQGVAEAYPLLFLGMPSCTGCYRFSQAHFWSANRLELIVQPVWWPNVLKRDRGESPNKDMWNELRKF